MRRSAFWTGFGPDSNRATDEETLLAAYNDAAGVTAKFNRNLLVRLNWELGGDFDPEGFEHRALWNRVESRIEMHLESRTAQRARLAVLDFEVEFAAGESIHTENCYKYRPGQAEAMLAESGFMPAAVWTDERGWYTVCLGKAGYLVSRLYQREKWLPLVRTVTASAITACTVIKIATAKILRVLQAEHKFSTFFLKFIVIDRKST